MRRIILSIAVLLTLGASAQTLTLQECIDEGLENSYQLKIVRISEEKAVNNDTWSNAGAMPTLSVSGSYSGSLNSSDSHQQSGTTSARDVFDQSLGAALRSEWTLFNGFSIQAEHNRLSELRNMGEIQSRLAIEDYVAEVATQYYTLVKQTIHLQYLDYATDLSRHRLRIVSDRYEMGSASRLELKQAQVYFNADSANSVKQHELVASAYIKLNRLLSHENLAEKRTPAESSIQLGYMPEFDGLMTDMLSTNSSLLKAESNRTLASLDRKAVQSRNYPYLKMNASYAYNHYIYGSSSVTSKDSWGPGVGVSVGMNLVSGKQRTQERNAVLSEMSAQTEIEQTELLLKANLTDLWQAYNNNLNLLELERQNLLTAQETHQIAEERYMLGDLSGFEMREAQKTLLSAEESLLTVEYNTKVCEISLLLISGHIMDLINNKN